MATITILNGAGGESRFDKEVKDITLEAHSDCTLFNLSDLNVHSAPDAGAAGEKRLGSAYFVTIWISSSELS